MKPIYLPYIQTNKKYNPYFEYSLFAPSNFTERYQPENAIDYSEDNKIRFSSITADTPPIYWSICFPEPVSIITYTFTEPDYVLEGCHQKSWDFYGATSKDSIWKLIDSQRNKSEHHTQSYVGSYSVNNSGPFRCFKLEAIEAEYYALTLTFRRFDVYANSYFFKYVSTKSETFVNFHLVKALIFIILINK